MTYLLGTELHTMGLVFDTVEEKLVQLQETPELLRASGFKCFELVEFPSLIEFYSKLNEKMIPHVIGAGATSLQDLERENIYKAILDDEDIELADRLVVAMAGGGLKSLYRNCSEVLTSQDGSLMFSKWSVEMIEMAKDCTADNIQAEGMFSKVDRTMRHGINFYMTTAAGIVVAKDGKLFNGVPLEGGAYESTDRPLHGNKEMFHMEAIRQEEAQEEANRMKLKEMQLYARPIRE